VTALEAAAGRSRNRDLTVAWATKTGGLGWLPNVVPSPTSAASVGYASPSSDQPGFCRLRRTPEMAQPRLPIPESPATADVAQLVEHFTRNEGVPGSSPGVGS
jgi:hypothetical protein